MARAKNPPRLRHILGYLGFQGFEGGKFLLGAQAVEEGDFDVLAVNVLVEIEEMQLEDALTGGGADGGAEAEVDDAFERNVAP